MKQTLKLLAVLVTALFGNLLSQAAVDPLEVLSIQPSPGSVESLQNFTITFGDLTVEVNEDAIPTLQKSDGGTYDGGMMSDDEGTTVFVDFEDRLTEAGQYTLTIPAGAITVEGQALNELSFRYTISGGSTFYDQITIDPAQGTVESLQNFTITFPAYVGEIAEGSRATLVNTTTGTTYQAEMTDAGYNVIVYMSDAVTEPGDYTLTIPAGSVIIYSLGEDVHELTFNYTIAGGSEPSFYDQITIDPAQGTVGSLQNFTITFPAYVGEIADGSRATLVNTTTGTTYQAEMTDAGYNVIVYMSDAVTEPGDYTLTIPAGSVIIYSLGEDVHELTFNYTIVGGSEAPTFTVNPPEGEVYLLQNFTLAFGSTVEVDEEVKPILKNDDDGTTYECSLLEISGNAFIYMEYPLSVLGNYTLTVPAGCIHVVATGQTNAEASLHYTIVEKETFVPTVIENQPEGELRIYQISGNVVREVEKEDPDAEWPYELVYEEQSGTISIVFADDNKVYIQHPVSTSYYDGWVEGTLSDDGTTITMPMGQYIAYTRTMEMAVQVAVFTYDQYEGTYFYDDSFEQLTYTIDADGTIRLNGTDQQHVLGTMNRVFGEQFKYLDYEWLQGGDYASVYTPIDERPLTPPEGLATEAYFLTTANFDGMGWETYKTTVMVGFDGNDMWLQGISKYLPDAWIKGIVEGNTVTFANPQLLGSYETLIYFKSADVDPATSVTTQKDLVLTSDDEGTYTTYDYVFITTDRDNLSYVNYYQGFTLSKVADQTVQVPEGLVTEEYVFSYETLETDMRASFVEGEHIVNLGFDGDDVYIQGVWQSLPDAWVKGHIDGGKLVIDMPQYLGLFADEYDTDYDIFLIGFDANTGRVNTQVTLDFDATTHIFDGASSPFCASINKTGYLSVKDFINAKLTPVNPYSSIITTLTDGNQPIEYYDLQGHKLTNIDAVTGVIIVKRADGTAIKILK